MNPDSHARLRALFEQALDVPLEARMAWVSENCANPMQRAKVLELLAVEAMESDLTGRVERAMDALDSSRFPSPLYPGIRLGDYELQRLIGTGGMGQVWEARQVSLGGRRVAIKVVRPDRVSPERLRFFEREARAGGRLSHPGIVSVHAFGQSEGIAWIAMEFIEGARTLREFIDEASRSTELARDHDVRVAGLVAEIADAMRAAHDAGVLHRDLKPQNVLLRSDGQPKVSDFGLARIVDEASLSQTGEITGTVFYMSPEQVRGRHSELDPRTDVFSLGVVLYEMLSLHRPFQGDTTHQVIKQILESEPADLRSNRSRIPRDLVTITSKALEKNRARRYSSMAELAADLRRFLADEPIQAKPPSRAERAVKWARRHPTQSAVSALASVALAIISLLLARYIGANANLSASNLALSQKTAELQQKNDDVMRLSALETHDELIARADALWPPLPVQIDAYEAWIGEAGKLVADLDLYRRKREELCALALPWSEEDRLADRRTHPDRPRLEAIALESERLGQSFVDATDEPEISKLEDQLARLSAESEQLEARIGERRTWRFPPDSPGARWWNDQLGTLIGAIESLSDETTGLLGENAVSPEHGWSIPKRLAFAHRLEAAQAPGREIEARWRAVLPAIAAAYPGLEIKPWIGLVPLGPDPDSGLWEFWHLASGTEPLRDPRTARFVLGEESGLVLVLLPGGGTWLGAQKENPAGRNWDPAAIGEEGPVHPVELSAFLISKYEMTQGQWQRLAGRNPSYYYAGHALAKTLVHPVEQVGWNECKTLMERHGLKLPSEAQWEYACRAGTQTPWWTGAERESLRQWKAANLADRAATRAGGTWQDIADWPDLDDGWSAHCPAGATAPNPFGLCETHGNVWEWCEDGHAGDAYSRKLPKDPVVPWQLLPDRVIRGGCYNRSATSARSANRLAHPPKTLVSNLGVRPVGTLAN